MKKAFLGGTAADSHWRDELIPQLKINYFNPVVEHWDDEARERELRERENCDFLVYVVTPEMEGFYAVAEVVDDSNKHPEKTIFCYLNEKDRFTKHQLKSLRAVGQLVERNGAQWLESLEDIANRLNR